jgi:DNA modification methylase
MQSLPENKVDMSIYSPPFGGLYNYSSSEKDLSNCKDYQEFFVHYNFVIEQIARVTKPGRITAVHCMDVPGSGNGDTARMGCGANVGTGLIDFPGDIIRAHEKHGFRFAARYAIWKEPLGVRNRTMAKGLAHKQVVTDASLCDVASADCLLLFRKNGDNPVPVANPNGLLEYAGEREIPPEVLKYRGHKGKQIENRYSHWIWRQYASSFWDDIRLERTLPYKQAREEDDERHMHPLQLDVVERIVQLRSLPGETVLTPFMGVGSEAYGAVLNGRKAIGVELKPAYYRQAVTNLEEAAKGRKTEATLFDAKEAVA